MIVWRDKSGKITDVTGSVNVAELERLKEEYGVAETPKGQVSAETSVPAQTVDPDVEKELAAAAKAQEKVLEQARQQAAQRAQEQHEQAAAALEEASAPVESEPAQEAESDEAGPPAKSATKQEWVDYCIAQGYDADECRSLTKDELIAQFGD